MNPQEKIGHEQKELGVKIFLGVALVLVVIVLLWGLTRNVNSKGSWSLANTFVSLTSVFKGTSPILMASSHDTLSSGKTLTLAWQNTLSEKNGSYSLFYPCVEGLYATTTTNGKNEVVFCNTEFNFINKNNNIALAIFSDKKHSVLFTPEIHFTKNNEEMVSAKGVEEITIINPEIKEEIKPVATTTLPDFKVGTSSVKVATTTKAVATTTKSQATTTPKKIATPVTPIAPKKPVAPVLPSEKKEKTYPLSSTTAPTYTNNPLGKTDLRTNILDIGFVDRTTNSYSATSTPRKNERVAVRFVVSNSGTKETGSWFFNAVLPTFPTNIFTSESQSSLMPGERVEFTLGFDGVLPEGGTIAINVDPTNSISEKDEENNLAKIQFTLTQ